MRFEVTNREIKCDYYSFKHLIGDNADYKATFTFDEEWNGYIKTARFMHNGKMVEEILENDECAIPVELLKKGCLKVGVYTSDMATTPCEVYIKESIKQENGTTPDPTPDVYSQIIAMLEKIEVQGVTDEQLEKAITKYFAEHPIETLTEEDVKIIVSEYVTEHKDELKGDKGDKGERGEAGYTPIKGVDYFDGNNGSDGKSAYRIAVDNGFIGSEADWLESLKGSNGADGRDGLDGKDGKDGIDGKDYVITSSDYDAIANVVLGKLDVAESEEY